LPVAWYEVFQGIIGIEHAPKVLVVEF